MNKVCLLALTVCAIVTSTQARECYLLINNMKCPYQCCGEEGGMKCMDSCADVECTTDDDCGDNGCCSKGKCNVPRSDCDSSHITFLRCSNQCPQGCCVTEYGVCQTGLGCFPNNINCSLNEACASNCCHEGKCRDNYVCEDDEQPISESHNEESSSSTTQIDWKIPVIVIAVIIAIAVKIALLVTWAARRSRSPVVEVQRVLVPTSDIQVNHHRASDTAPFLSQDEEQIKHLQAASEQTTTA